MRRSVILIAIAAVLPVGLRAVHLTAQAQPGFSIATYNISGGKGAGPLGGHECTFTEGMNCTDASKPMNAWGKGVIQRELQRVVSAHPRIAGMVLDESYQALCGPSEVQKTLGGKDHVPEQNGVTALARFGFRGKPEWLQLDTSRSQNPKDTAWVVRVQMCIEENCRATLPSTRPTGTAPAAHALTCSSDRRIRPSRS